ncbi:MAG: SCO family protein [Alphaproteobacteria bacterium]
MKRLTLLIVVVVLSVIGMVVAVVFGDRTGEPVPPGKVAGTPAPLKIGGPFTLVNQDGKTVTDADFHGRFMLIYFGYTYCPDLCPTSLQAMTEAIEQLPAEKRERVVPVLITIDPERDTPTHLKNYVGAFGPNVVGLTGSPEQIAAVAKAFRVYFARVEGEYGMPYLMDHTSIIYVMGPDGKYVIHFGHGNAPEVIAAGLRQHL